MRVTMDDQDVDVTVTDQGAGRPVLLLHGGGGPATVAGFAGSLEQAGLRVLTPVHPGFNGTPRPERVATIADLARLYVRLLDELDLTDVTVVGNSIGGWIAAEIALLHSDRVGRAVLVDAAGLRLDSHPIADFFSLTMDQVADLSYRDPDAFRIDVAAMTDGQRAAMAANRATLSVYGGTTMADPTLLGRLADAGTPTLVVWGAADRIVPVEHGHAYAKALPHARFELIEDAGHLPQLETPDRLRELVVGFLGE